MQQFGKVTMDQYESFAVIELADGRSFQVRKDDLVRTEGPNKGYDLKSGAKIYAAFPAPPPEPERTIVFLPPGFEPIITQNVA